MRFWEDMHLQYGENEHLQQISICNPALPTMHVPYIPIPSIQPPNLQILSLSGWSSGDGLCYSCSQPTNAHLQHEHEESLWCQVWVGCWLCRKLVSSRPFRDSLVDLLVSAMAGNIIPAIATTNAVIAGLIVLEGLKILSGQIESCRTVSSVSSVLGYSRRSMVHMLFCVPLL